MPTVFTKNRERLIAHDAVIELFNRMLEQAEDKGLLSGEHFSVHGTLIQTWAGHKSFVRKDGGDDDASSANFKSERPSNDTHESNTSGAALGRARPHPASAGYTISVQKRRLIEQGFG